MHRVKEFFATRLPGLSWSRTLTLLRRNARALFYTRRLLKGMSLILAILLWHAITATDVASYTFEPSLLIVRGEDVFVKGVPEKVRLMVRGPANQVEKLAISHSRVLARFRLRNELRQGPIETVTIDTLHDLDFDPLPSELDVISVTPQQIRFQVEDLIERYVRVRPLFTGNVAEGYELLDPVPIDPSEVVVRGHFSLLEELSKIGYLYTRPIPLDGRSAADEWQTFYLDLGRIPELEGSLDAGVLTCEQPMVKVHLAIRPKLADHLITGVPICLLSPANFPYRVEMEQGRQDVRVRGAAEVVAQLRADDVRLFVDLGPIKGVGKKELVPEVKLPDGVQLARPLETVTLAVFLHPSSSSPPEDDKKE